MSTQRKRRGSMLSWLWCCGGPVDEVDEPSTSEASAPPVSVPSETVSPSDKASLEAALSPKSPPDSRPTSVQTKRDSLRAFSTAFDTEAVFPDEGVVYEVLGLKYERGTLRSDPRSKGEHHLRKVEQSAREARDAILNHTNLPTIVEEMGSGSGSIGSIPAVSLEPVELDHVQALLKVSLVLADVLQLQGRMEEADHVLGDTLDRLLDAALEQSARISESQGNPLNAAHTSAALSAASKEEQALPLRLKAAAHHRMGSIKRSQGDLLSAETHLRAAAEILGRCAAAGDKTANGEKAATLALLATILMRVGKEDEASLVDREALSLRAATEEAEET